MEVNEFVAVTTETIECRRCGNLEEDASCNHATTDELSAAVSILEQRRRRKTRPTWTLLGTVVSQNHNGSYSLNRLSDGSFGCSCMSFLSNNGLREKNLPNHGSFPICKHLSDYLDHQNRLPDHGDHRTIKAPSEWQSAFLKNLCILPHEKLSSEQAYFIIDQLLRKQGVSYVELEGLLKNKGRFSVLPTYAFGIELEGTHIARERLGQELNRAGILSETEHYNHGLRNLFKITTDATIRGPHPFELVSPKLFGAEGFKTLSKVCEIVKQLGGQVNRSCGLHVHIDAWNFDIADVRRLIRVIWRIEQPVLHFLIPQSRRNGQYSRAVTEELVRKINRMRSIESLARIQSRYFSINLAAWFRHRTFEFRNHSGTFSEMKVISWIVFILMLMDAVKRGMDASDVKPTWPDLAEAIGLTNGTSLIERAHRYLTARNEKWRSAS